MKKLSSLAFVFALLFSLSSIPAYAMDNTGMSSNQTRMSDSTYNMNNYRSNDGVTNDYRANNVNNYQTNTDGVTHDYRANNVTNNQAHRYRATANNYRTTAVDNNRGTNWGWLGLLGLTGLFGLRSRERERER